MCHREMKFRRVIVSIWVLDCYNFSGSSIECSLYLFAGQQPVQPVVIAAKSTVVALPKAQHDANGNFTQFWNFNLSIFIN